MTVCCSVAVCDSVLQCVTVCCSVTVCDSVLQCCSVWQCVAVCDSVLQCCSVWQCVAVLQCVTVCCIAAVYCSVLQCVALWSDWNCYLYFEWISGFCWWVLQHCFLDKYCSTVQGLLDWFEVDLGFPSFHLFKSICVFCVFLFSTPASHSPLVLFGHSALPPPRGGSASRVSPQSCQSHESLWGSWYSLCCALSNDHLLYWNCYLYFEWISGSNRNATGSVGSNTYTCICTLYIFYTNSYIQICECMCTCSPYLQVHSNQIKHTCANLSMFGQELIHIE